MKGYVCKMCGFISIDGTAPGKCPVCGAPESAFEEKDNAVKEPEDAGNLTDLEKKHIPVIHVVKKCGLLEGCQDVHVNMGEIPHPMTPEHSIGSIDFYLDKKFVARVHLTPEKLNAAAALHMKSDASGKLSVVSSCNLHGCWMSGADL